MEKRDMKIMNIVCDRICGRLDHCMCAEECEDMCDTCPLVQFFETERLQNHYIGDAFKKVKSYCASTDDCSECPLYKKNKDRDCCNPPFAWDIKEEEGEKE